MTGADGCKSVKHSTAAIGGSDGALGLGPRQVSEVREEDMFTKLEMVIG